MRWVALIPFVILILALMAVATYAATEGVRKRRKARRDREVVWTTYCRPERPQGKPVVYRIGVERRTEDGRVLSDVHMRDVPIGDELERLAVEEEARLRALQYNESRVGM